jgi:hypothetical protein
VRRIYLFLLIVVFGCKEELPLNSDEISLKLSSSSYRKIVSKREEALQLKLLYSSKDDYVKGELLLNGVSIDVKARLKGDHLDHLKGNRWSFRIKSEKPILGHRKFSIHNVATRRYQLEWVFHRLLKNIGVIGLDYHFVTFSLNDSLKGIYAYESHFKNELLDSNDRTYGPILGFDESKYWEGSKFDGLNEAIRDDSIMVNADLKIYNKKWCAKNDFLKEEALLKLKDFQQGIGKLDTIIDMKMWAKYITISELMGYYHNLRWHNLKFYFNPKTKLLEPIGYDSGANFDLSYIWFLSDKLELIYRPLRKSDQFMKLLKKEFNLVKQEEWLDDFFKKNRTEVDYNERLVQLENSKYEFQERTFYYAQDKLVIP